ncbi:hypothetical protein GCM10010428_22960 [Actinosynnema pretiosum subsp. pretiosum]
MTLLDRPARQDFQLIGETLAAAGRARSGVRYPPSRNRRFRPPPPAAGFLDAVTDVIGRRSGSLFRRSGRPSRETELALCRAQEALGRLDEAVHRSPLREGWGHAVRLREVQQLAHLHGVHVSLREVWQTQLPGQTPRIATEPALLPHLDTVLGTSPGEPPERESALPGSAQAALWHLHALGKDPFTAFGGLPGLLVAGGVLRDAWFPLVNAITTDPAEYLAALHATIQADSTEPAVSHFAHGVIDACRREIVLLDRLAVLREHQLTTLSRSHVGRILEVVAALATTPVLNNRWIVERLRITVNAAVGISSALVDHGLLVPHPHFKHGAVFCNPQALRLHSGLPAAST